MKDKKHIKTFEQHTDKNLNISDVSFSWIPSSNKPKNSDIVAVLLKDVKYPSLAHYNKKFDEWTIEENGVKGTVEYWFPLPPTN